MFREELEAFMKAARLISPMDRVFLTKKGDHFEKIAQRAPDWSKQRERLWELQEQSLAHIHQLVSLAAEEKPEFSTHPGDAATDTFDRDLTLSLVSFEQEKLYEIEAALKRIDDGSYGICELTGQPILRRRLDAIPWTRFSEAAERQLGTTSHPHLGVLHSMRPISGTESDDHDLEAMETDWPSRS
jgi:RNA polymerase-binding transcription factor DksA